MSFSVFRVRKIEDITFFFIIIIVLLYCMSPLGYTLNYIVCHYRLESDSLCSLNSLVGFSCLRSTLTMTKLYILRSFKIKVICHNKIRAH